MVLVHILFLLHLPHQVLRVADRCSIKEFVLRNSLIFRTGRGFYEFTKPEVISSKKVLVDRETGDMFTGSKAADMIGGETYSHRFN